MQEEDLRVWLTNKRTAQTKLKNYLESAAMYLTKPGNTQSGWITQQKESANKPKVRKYNAATGKIE